MFLRVFGEYGPRLHFSMKSDLDLQCLQRGLLVALNNLRINRALAVTGLNTVERGISYGSQLKPHCTLCACFAQGPVPKSLQFPRVVSLYLHWAI